MSNSIEETLDDELDDDHPLSLVNSQIEGLLEGDGASEDHEDVIAFLLATGLPRSTVDRVHKAIVWGDSKVQPPKQRHPWPNHNFCVGCTGETCMGCGTEPQERRKTPAAVEQRVTGAHPDLAAPYSPVKWQEADREKLRDVLAEALGDSTYCCTRVWNAWNVGTMGPDDFIPAADVDDVLDGLTAAVLQVVAGGSTSEGQS